MIPQELSNKIKICSYLATIMVVYRHSFVLNAFFPNNDDPFYLRFVNNAVASITEIAVPLFFLISGFFFFKKNYTSFGVYKEMIIRKTCSLLIPFCIWNIVGIFVLLLWDRSLFGKSAFENVTLFVESRFYGPLWFVRDLFVMMMLVPLYQWIIRTSHKIITFPLLLLLFCIWYPVDCSLLSTEGLLFFFIGGLLNVFDLRNVLLNRLNSYMLFVITLFWITISLFYPIWNNIYIHKMNTIIGIIAFWYLLRYIPNMWQQKMIRLSSFSFFIYVTHFYTVKAMKILIATIIPQNGEVALLTFLILPVFTVLLLLYLANLMIRYCPKIYYVLTGNR